MVDFSLGNLGSVQIGRISSSYLHCNILAKFIISTDHLNENADLAAAMDIAVYLAFSTFITNETANGNVFTNLCNCFSNKIAYFLSVDFRIQKCFNISWVNCQDLVCNGCSEISEVFVGSHEVSFAVDFQNGSCFSVFGNSRTNSAFSSNTACLLSSLG